MIIDIIGYLAAGICNISMYPQAYEVNQIIKHSEYDKLNSISVSMLLFLDVGCFLWGTYAILLGIYPLLVGSIMTIIPASYMIICKLLYCNKITLSDSNGL